MLELLKILTEAALKLLDPAAIEKFRREGKQRKLGVSLFRLYINLVDLIIQGERPVEFVSDIVEHKGLMRYTSNWLSQYSEKLRVSVERQAVIVEKFSTTFFGLFGPLIAVDSEAAEVIAHVLGIKTLFLDHVTKTVLWQGHLPLEQVASDEMVSNQVQRFRHLARKVDTDFLPVLDEWSDEHYEKAQLYLSTASEQLKQLRESAAKLKTSLEKHFSLKDVLPELMDSE